MEKLQKRCGISAIRNYRSIHERTDLIRRSGVTLICTTDDPADSLYWHKELAADDSFEVQVLPAWRPDKAMNIEKPDYAEYLKKLGQAARCQIEMFADLKNGIKEENGCI